MPPISSSSSSPSVGVARTDASAADVVESLRLLLLVAYLQSELYTRATATAGFVPTTDGTVIVQLRDHETTHVTTLLSLITSRGGLPPTRPAIDFTGKGAVPGFAFAAGQYETFRMLAQAFEDLSVRAYKGQVQALVADKAALTYALALHAVEARHAAEVRRLRGKKPWITGNSTDDLPAFAQAIYAGEEVTTQGTVNVATTGGATAAAQAFDEPLTAVQVTAILTPFIT